jgi:hypothetical protein
MNDNMINILYLPIYICEMQDFLFIVLVGYGSGILHKILYSPDVVIVLHILNFIIISTDILLYFRNKKGYAKIID